jgi:hypothetical protein
MHLTHSPELESVGIHCKFRDELSVYVYGASATDLSSRDLATGIYPGLVTVTCSQLAGYSVTGLDLGSWSQYPVPWVQVSRLHLALDFPASRLL